MKTFRTCRPWASGAAVIFLLGVLIAVATPVSAVQGAEKKKEAAASGSAFGPPPEARGGLERHGADPQGPPVNLGPGCYKKIPGKSDKAVYKYFKNGHPENPSEWEYVGSSCEPYGQ